MFPCKTTQPPNYAVIFPSSLSEGDRGYEKASKTDTKTSNAKKLEKSVWYEDYMLRIAKVERGYGKES